MSDDYRFSHIVISTLASAAFSALVGHSYASAGQGEISAMVAGMGIIAIVWAISIVGAHGYEKVTA